MKTTITIKGTHCASCKALIEDICKDSKGALSCAVNFQTGQTAIEHDERFDWQAFKKEVEGLGDYILNPPEK